MEYSELKSENFLTTKFFSSIYNKFINLINYKQKNIYCNNFNLN